MRRFLTGLDVNSQKVVNVADPSAPLDAVNLQYLQAFLRGLSWKAAVRAASTGNVSVASPGATLDGVTLVTGDRVLLKNQTAGAENGIYTWTGSAAALTRTPDADSAAELVGASVLVTEGTANQNTQWNQTIEPITLGTTALVWAQFGGGSAAYTAGNGLQLSSNAFSVLLDTSSGLAVSGTGLKLDTAVAVRKYAADVPTTGTTVTITHSLGTTDVTYQLREKATGVVVETDVTVVDANNLTLTFPTAPTSGQYRIVVHG